MMPVPADDDNFLEAIRGMGVGVYSLPSMSDLQNR